MNRIKATQNPDISDRERKNMERARAIAAECIVLLSNDMTLPIEPGKIALYGNGARHTVKGGTGSGDVNSRFMINVEDGLIDAGYEIATKKWLDLYDAEYDKYVDAYFEKLSKMKKGTSDDMLLLLDYPMGQPDIPKIEDKHVAKDVDTALYILSRNSGEGADRKNVPGDYQLLDSEKDALKKLSESYKHLVVILNVGNVIDLKFIKSINPAAILLMSQLGNVSGYALADVVSGKVSPSGHLTTTWAENYEDYPSSAEFGLEKYDEYYKDGIYVGYRYFDTFHRTPAFPFGFGWTYSKFDSYVKSADVKNGVCEVVVGVKNIGNTYAAKQVIQLYYSAPKGRLDKPHQELCAFGKTRLLHPGESQDLKLTFNIADMASYDEELAAYVLEFGEYVIRYGESSVNTHIALTLSLDFETVVKRVKNLLPLDNRFDEISPRVITPVVYSWETMEREKAPYIIVNTDEIKETTVRYKSINTPLRTSSNLEFITVTDVNSSRATLDDLICQLTTEELVELCVGIGRADEGGESVVGAASPSCAGAAGETTSSLKERGIKNLILADGPAGLRLAPEFMTTVDGEIIPESLGEVLPGQIRLCGKTEYEMPKDAEKFYQYTTAIPIATALAQTWDMNAIESAGDIVGGEMEEFGVDLWLAPGMNIHRNPLCGRNFEYYSEDPLLTGMCAAADTKGVQKHKGKGTTIKHFAFNNREDNRLECNSHIKERAIREIYLRGFEIAIRESNPLALMTSYNLINGEHTANSFDLVSSILRDEFGYDGLVMTDWGTTGGTLVIGEEKYKLSSSSACIRVGNDLIMPGTAADIKKIMAGLEIKGYGDKNKISIADLQACAKRIIKLCI